MASPEQLPLVGLDETLQYAETLPKGSRSRVTRRALLNHDLLRAEPEPGDFAFLHAGLCQTFLPHAKPTSNQSFWRRTSGYFTLLVTPGVIDRAPTPGVPGHAEWVGVPYGAKARLVLIYLQTEGLKSRTVPLGPNLAAFLRSLGLDRTGGRRGNIPAVREQCLRIARCQFTMQWSSPDGTKLAIKDKRLVEGLELWGAGAEWNAVVELTNEFHTHLRDHAVPLDKRAIAMLAGNSIGLDLYAMFAHRLPRLKAPLLLTWARIAEELGSDYTMTKHLAERIRQYLPLVQAAYAAAKVEHHRRGLTLYPSAPAVPRTLVNGLTLVKGGEDAAPPPSQP